MKTKNLELKIYIVGTVLLDLLDQTEGSSIFKQKLKFNIKRTIKELECLTDVEMMDEEVDLFIQQSWKSLEESIDGKV